MPDDPTASSDRDDPIEEPGSEERQATAVSLTELIERGSVSYSEADAKAMAELAETVQAQLASTMAPLARLATETITRSFIEQLPRFDPLKSFPRVVPPDLFPRFDSFIALVFQNVFEEQNKRMVAQLQQLLPDLSGYFRPLLSDFAEHFDQLRVRHMPPNWPTQANFRDAVDFVADTGWPIVWLPREHVLSELLHADPAAREEVLLAHEVTIVHDALELMEGVGHESLVYLAGCVSEIAGSIRAGHYRAAQSLAASVLTEILQGLRGFRTLKEASIWSTVDPGEAELNLFRHHLVISTVPEALSQFYRHRGDPVPTRFNRHAVAHSADPVQFTTLNALIGLMLVAALVREYQELADLGILVAEEDETD